MNIIMDTEDSGTASLVCKKKDLCEKLFEFSDKTIINRLNRLEEYLLNKTCCPKSKEKDFKKKFNSVFKKYFLLKWKSRKHSQKSFMEKERHWLNENCNFKNYTKTLVILSNKNKRGRPKTNFSESCESTKRRKIMKLRKEYRTEELLFAAQMNLRSEGKTVIADIVKNALSPSLETICREAFPVVEIKITPTEAASLLADAKLTKNQYETTHGKLKSHGKGIFPCYNSVFKEKKKSYPSNIHVTETVGEVALQSLLDHTAKRLAEYAEIENETKKHELDAMNTKIILHTKWGFDGSSGHTEYKQKFADDSSYDKFVFMSCILPLQMTAENESFKVTLWNNSKSSSTRFCRPLRINFQKESDELVKSEKNKIDDEIKKLLPTSVPIGNQNFTVEHRLIFCMIDGKICNTLTDNKSAQRCYLCNATSKEFNDISKMSSKPVNESYLSFGISLLHAWIRMFELLLHIAYKLPVKQWRCANDVVKDNKKRIQKEFRKRTGLIIDIPKPGFGNSNDGNVARAFFQNAQVSSEITGIDYDLIKKFHVILKTMSSKQEINPEKFKQFCLQTAELYNNLYSWYYMSTSVHKILIHGYAIIHEAPLPIGQLSEEAQEARNKDFKFYREHLSRKTSRTDTMRDVFCRMLFTSDPFISLNRTQKDKEPQDLDPDVQNLLQTE